MPYKDKNKTKEYQRLWYLKNKIRHNKTSHNNYIKNKEIICNRSILWRKNNTDKLKGIWKRSRDKRYLKYRDKILRKAKEWRLKNKQQIRVWRRKNMEAPVNHRHNVGDIAKNIIIGRMLFINKVNINVKNVGPQDA